MVHEAGICAKQIDVVTGPYQFIQDNQVLTETSAPTAVFNPAC